MCDTLQMKSHRASQINTTDYEESVTFIGVEEKDVMKESKPKGEKEGFRGRGKRSEEQGPIHHRHGGDAFQCLESEDTLSQLTMEG